MNDSSFVGLGKTNSRGDFQAVTNTFANGGKIYSITADRVGKGIFGEVVAHNIQMNVTDSYTFRGDLFYGEDCLNEIENNPGGVARPQRPVFPSAAKIPAWRNNKKPLRAKPGANPER